MNLQSQIARHAKSKLAPLLRGVEFADEVFLCGGVYKSLLNPALPVYDLDLWVRNRKKREQLTADLLRAGARMLCDFAPFCIKFTRSDILLELNYQNLNELGIPRVLDHCDLGVCALGAVWQQGQIIDVVVADSFLKSARDRTVYLHDTLLGHLTAHRPPSVLRTLHRLEQAAEELQYRQDPHGVNTLWDLYGAMDEEEQRANLDLYQSTMVEYKRAKNAPLLQRARSLGQVACAL